MKTIITILISLVLFTSCKKESGETCYECSYAMTAGVQKPNDVRCTEGEPPITYDNAGNPIGQFCSKR